VYGEVPVVTVGVKVLVCPWVNVLGEGETEGAAKTGFTVTEGAEDGTEVMPKLSVTVTVIKGDPVEPGT